MRAKQGMKENLEPNATVSVIRWLHESLAILRVRPDGPLPAADPGQHTTLGFSVASPGAGEEMIRRIFSISSSILDDGLERLRDPARVDFHEFYIALDGTTLADRLSGMMPGHRIWMSPDVKGSYSTASLPVDADVVFCATGTGEAPHNRMIEELLRRKHRGRIVSVVCCRRQQDLGYDPVHRRLLEMFSNYTYLPMTTREGSGPRRHIQDLFVSGDFQNRSGLPLDSRRTHVFLCGNSGMVGRPQETAGGIVYPEGPGMVEVLTGDFGFRITSPGQPGNIHFEHNG
jgi:ferredoxin--NADP+ reductase